MIALVVIAVLLRTSTVLGAPSGHCPDNDHCLQTQKLLWRGEMTWKDVPVTFENFANEVNYVHVSLDQTEKPDRHMFFVMQSEEIPAPSVSVNGKSYRFYTLRATRLNEHDESTVLQADFAHLADEISENDYISFVVPLIPRGNGDASSTASVDNALLFLSHRSATDQAASLQWLKPLLEKVVPMDEQSEVIGPVQKFDRLFLTACAEASVDIIGNFLDFVPEYDDDDDDHDEDEDDEDEEEVWYVPTLGNPEEGGETRWERVVFGKDQEGEAEEGETSWQSEYFREDPNPEEEEEEEGETGWQKVDYKKDPNTEEEREEGEGETGWQRVDYKKDPSPEEEREEGEGETGWQSVDSKKDPNPEEEREEGEGETGWQSVDSKKDPNPEEEREEGEGETGWQSADYKRDPNPEEEREEGEGETGWQSLDYKKDTNPEEEKEEGDGVTGCQKVHHGKDREA